MTFYFNIRQKNKHKHPFKIDFKINIYQNHISSTKQSYNQTPFKKKRFSSGDTKKNQKNLSFYLNIRQKKTHSKHPFKNHFTKKLPQSHLIIKTHSHSQTSFKKKKDSLQTQKKKSKKTCPFISTFDKKKHSKHRFKNHFKKKRFGGASY